MKARASQYLGQALLYGLFFVPLVYITSEPLYQQQPADTATLKLAVRHVGKIVGECTRLGAEEYDNLPANMKRPETCPRERSPLQIEMMLDDDTLYRDTVPASGLHSDGVSSMYQRFAVPAGRHLLRLRMNDDVAVEGPTWELEQEIELTPAQVMVLSFKEGFRIQ
ncbi:MAG: hypothetical protein ABJ308_06440 [Halieaceae bacterium]